MAGGAMTTSLFGLRDAVLRLEMMSLMVWEVPFLEGRLETVLIGRVVVFLVLDWEHLEGLLRDGGVWGGHTS